MLYYPQDNQGGNKDWRAGNDKTGQIANPRQDQPGKNMPGQSGQPNTGQKDFPKAQDTQPYGNAEEQEDER